MLRDSPWLKTRMLLLVFPHVVDTVLLVSALWLTVLIGQYPFTSAWLTVKVLLLVVYILLGSIALRWGRTRTVRITAFAGAVCVFLFIISVAHTHHPLGALYILR
ncbi:MAG: SirB2 family protein [Gammaproteobacteria bacterium]